MKHLIVIISILMLVSVAAGTAVSITIYGTNQSNAQSNVTCYGCNNTISVQAWNISRVKNISVNSVNASGDVVTFNISNVTGYQVQELKVNGTAVNGFQAGANGMLNFSYTVTGNKTLVLSPAVNVNGGNTSWAKIWNISIANISQSTKSNVVNTVYQNGNRIRFVEVCVYDATVAAVTWGLYSGLGNPPLTLLSGNYNTNNYLLCNSGYILPNYYYQLSDDGSSNSVISWAEYDI